MGDSANCTLALGGHMKTALAVGWGTRVGGVYFGRASTARAAATIAAECWRRFKIEPPCRLNFEPGLMANL